jgi:hypothetical protein
MIVCSTYFLGMYSSSNHIDDSTYSLMQRRLVLVNYVNEGGLTVQDGHAYGRAFTNDITDMFSGAVKGW